MAVKIPLIKRSANKKRVMVMGGSFNPPTLAHGKLMAAAVEAAGAKKGLFVPARGEYVKKKMRRCNYPREVLSEETRLNMLLRMCGEDPRLDAVDWEYGLEAGAKTYEMMETVQGNYPDAELWFIIGADKLSVISRWHRSEEFLQRFHILVSARDGILAQEQCDQNPLIRSYADSFRLLQEPEGIDAVSSTRVRECLRSGDRSAARLVHPEVWEMLCRAGWLKESITSFRGRYEFLSNFYEAPLEYDGLRYGSGEAAFQAQKCVDREERARFQDMRPAKAKRAGRNVKLRADWEQVKVELMEEIVRAKFTQNPELARMLLATGERLIQEGNTWHDVFWGVDAKTGEGENQLGRILMKIRAQLRGACEL